SVSLSARTLSIPPLFPYTTLFRSLLNLTKSSITKDLLSGTIQLLLDQIAPNTQAISEIKPYVLRSVVNDDYGFVITDLNRRVLRSEEHTSELQSRENLVCRLLLAK